MQQKLTGTIRYSDKELAELRICYLRSNKMRLSLSVLSRAIAILIIGVIIVSISLALIQSLIMNFISEQYWNMISDIISVFTGIMLILWIHRLDDRKRFAEFIAHYQAEQDGGGNSVALRASP